MPDEKPTEQYEKEKPKEKPHKNDPEAATVESRHQHTVSDKILSAMRHQFGGHVEEKKKP